MTKAERAQIRAKIFDRENDEIADSSFPWRELTPEEWIAHHGHTVGAFSLHKYRYANSELGQWIQRLGELLNSGDETLDNFRKKYLSPAEYNQIQQEIRDQIW